MWIVSAKKRFHSKMNRLIISISWIFPQFEQLLLFICSELVMFFACTWYHSFRRTFFHMETQNIVYKTKNDRRWWTYTFLLFIKKKCCTFSWDDLLSLPFWGLTDFRLFQSFYHHFIYPMKGAKYYNVW